MAFSRYRSAGRRSFGSRFRRGRVPRGSFHRQPHEPRKYERCNLFLELDCTIANASANTSNFAIELATIENLIDETSRQGKSLGNQMRSVDIGGIVLDWGCETDRTSIDTEFGNPAAQCTWNCNMLVSDRIDITGAPVAAAACEYFDPQVPFLDTQAMSIGSPNPTDDWAWPTQIHYRETQRIDISSVELLAAEGGIFAVNGQRLHTGRSGKMNKRLKVRLDDDHGLYWVTSFRTGAAYGPAGSQTWLFWLHGTLYYRTRF